MANAKKDPKVEKIEEQPQQRPANGSDFDRSNATPEERRDAVLADIEADHAGKPRP